MSRTTEFSIGGTDYVVSPNFAVIERIEERVNVFGFMRASTAGTPKMKEIAWVIYAALAETDGNTLKYQDVGDMVLEHFTDAFNAATAICADAMSGGPEKPTKKKT